MNERPVITSQSWLVDKMKQIGLTSDPKGVCYGVAAIGALLIIAGKGRYYDELAYTLDYYGHGVYKERLDEIRQKVKEKKLNTLTETELDILDSAAFLEAVEVAYQPNLYPDLFVSGHQLVNQNVTKVLPLIMTASLEKMGENSVVEAANFSGPYTIDSLYAYFYLLSASFSSMTPPLSHPVSLFLGSSNHAITVGFEPNGKWRLIDANSRRSSVTDDLLTLSASVIKAFSENDAAVFSTQVFASKADAEKIKECMAGLRKNPNWQRIHSPKRTAHIKDSYGLSWLHKAAYQDRLR